MIGISGPAQRPFLATLLIIFVSCPSAFGAEPWLEQNQDHAEFIDPVDFSAHEIGAGFSAYSTLTTLGSGASTNAGCDAGGCDTGYGCDTCCCEKNEEQHPCATSHKILFFANDFGYRKDLQNNRCCLGDCLKLIPVGDCGRFGTMDIGGQLRLRYHHEEGMAQTPGLTRFQDNSNDFSLTRLRLYTNWQINDWARFYVEGIYAGLSAANDYVPRRIDENYGDLQNIFVDIKLTGTTTVRLGRQELLYGAQRTVTPLDWANTRLKFEGLNVLWRNGDWAVDAFYTNFVPVTPNQFDRADYDLTFYGMYSVYSGLKNATVDFYYLGFDNGIVGAPIATDFSLHTLGVRLNGSCGCWLYELEGAPQFGRQSGLALDHMAGFATVGIGRKIQQLPWGTTVWFYYDYASGNNIGGDFNRYNHLFPLGHKYLGFIDATQRSNIESPNLLVTTNPTKKVSLLLWYYHLMANQATDVVPSIGGTPAQSTTSRDWGDEIDLVASYAIHPRSNILVGWSHFWAGNKIVSANKSDADFFYTQWMLNF